jgi:hypothetical protein
MDGITLTNVMRKPMRHHMLGLQYTASGYGSKLPTELVAKINGRLHRLYCAIWSNVGTVYVIVGGKKVIADFDDYAVTDYAEGSK